MNVISSSYGNDSMALIRWAYEQGLPNCTVVYCDTGWASPEWPARVKACEAVAEGYGFNTVRINSLGMADLVRQKKGWPGNGQQFCTLWLKGLPFLNWIDENDPECESTILIGKRRAESVKRRDTPEHIDHSEYHGGRWVWHPLYLHTDDERNALVERTGVPLLPHRSQECNPCVNANRGDLLRLTTAEIERVNDLEVEIGKSMFRPKRFGAMGIYGVMAWAKYGRKREDEDLLEDEGCGAPFGCGL